MALSSVGGEPLSAAAGLPGRGDRREKREHSWAGHPVPAASSVKTAVNKTM